MKHFVTLLAGLAAVSALPSSLEPRGQKCYAGVYVVVARGTFEFEGVGVQGNLVTSILNQIPNSNSTAIVYPASVIDYGGSVEQGSVNAQKQLTDYYNACPNSKIVVLGYSQGAQVVGSALSGGSTGIPVLGGTTGANAALSQDVGKNIIAINLLGDPNRTLGQGKDFDPDNCSNVGSETPRNGTNFAAMQFYADRLAEWCKNGDPVCCAKGNDGGAHVSYLTDENIQVMTNFVVQKYYGSQ